MVKTPIEKGRTRRSFLFKSICALSNRGSSMLMIRRSELRLKEKFTIRWCSAVVH
jgi:hypothetical protein